MSALPRNLQLFQPRRSRNTAPARRPAGPPRSRHPAAPGSGPGPPPDSAGLGRGPRPGPVKPPPRGCAGRTRPQASWRAREGNAALPRAPGFRPPLPPEALGAAASSPPWNPGPGPGHPEAREREAGESAPGPGPGAGGGRAARDRSRGSPLAPSALPGSGPRAARRAGPGRGSRCLLRERRLALGATEASLPPGRRGLVTQVDWGTLEYGALPTFLQVRRRPGRQRRQFEEEGAKSFCTQK